MGEAPTWMRAAVCLGCCFLGIACLDQESSAPRESDSVGAAGARIAASVPDTDIYLADLEWQGGFPKAGPLRNISRRIGYDNQPHFFADGRSLVYSSVRDGEQSDIWRYVIRDGQDIPFGQTPESEYSPTPMPDGAGISVVRVEGDGTQRLWQFVAANAAPTLLIPSVTGVGYHAWLGAGLVALFIVDEPPRLVVFDLEGGELTPVASNIGRGLARIPGEPALAFIAKEEDAWRIVRYDMVTGSLAELIDTPPGSEDFAWISSGGVFMGDGMVLRYWGGRPDAGWMTAADYSALGRGRITRLNVAPGENRIAIVISLEAQAHAE